MRSKQVRNQLEIVQGDITKLDCDCIVNPANRRSVYMPETSRNPATSCYLL